VATPDGPAGGGEGPLDLIVVGHTNLDVFLRVRSLPAKDRTVPLLAMKTELGGTAANIARAAGRAGLRVGLVSRVGESFPRDLEKILSDARIDLRGFERVPGADSPTCFIVEAKDGNQVTLIHQGPMGDRRPTRIPEPLLERAAWLHLSTGEPGYLLRWKDAARRRGVRVTADPAQEVHYRYDAARLRRLVDGCEILFGNRSEVARASQLLGVRGPQALLRLVPLVVETRGPQGAAAYSRTGTVVVPAPRVASGHRSIVGAGDAFRGGFYRGWLGGRALADCLREGVRASTRWIRERSESPRARRSAP
jgi:sugar/nucleoside kinase (ribokinase family)